jgi:hypothetical protein
MFDMHSSLAEISVGDRPRRDRANEAAEVRRKELRELGLCIDCEEPSRAQRCPTCLARVEGNTVRDANKRGRRGRLTKSDDFGLDLGLSVRELSEARAMLVEAYNLPRSAQRTEAIKQAKAKLLLGIGFANHVIERIGGGDE